ncbi:hypothetical protein ACQJBY_061083 [Aegilops geniculata]
MQQFLAAQPSSNGSTAAAAAAAAPPPSPSPLRSRPPRREQPSQSIVKEATMADEHQELTKAFSGMGGLGVEETALVSALGRWRKQPEKRAQFRRGFPGFFAPAGAGAIERCSDDYVRHLKTEFARFKTLMVLWAMHPWERDARWAHRALHKKHHPVAVLVELACTRAADELLGARRTYHTLYHRSLEEDVAYRIKDAAANRLLLGLVTAYRYEGPRVDEELAREEAAALSAGPGAKAAQSELVVRVLATRSKPQLRATFRLYRELHGKPLEEEFGGDAPCLREAVRCLESPAKYFGEVIDGAFKEGADKQAKAALTRVVVSRSDADMEEIKETYLKQHGAKLVDVVAKNTHGHYRDALLAMIGK